ncbi:MAG TPA: cytochrome c3 family protein [Pyrinomonadaceae bacterium]|nr:cytochrome c3 family protein [Pyrinomonadaceae bacterium]
MQSARTSRVWIIVLVVGSLALFAAFCSREQARAREFRNAHTEAEQGPEATGDFSRFLHRSPNHARLPCLLCHRREGNSPRPALPGANGHLPCAGCHAQQFANNESPICTICHTDAKSGAVKGFPPLKSFRVKFDHARHIGMAGVSCSTCHKAARGGVSFSIPVGFNAHIVCYSCHVPRRQAGGRDISSCGVCHQLGGYARTPSWTTAFRMNFSHAKHSAAQGLNCNACHSVRAGTAQRRQVTAPQAANHHAVGTTQSCMSCHNGKAAFGGDDFSACKRCHTGNTWHF